MSTYRNINPDASPYVLVTVAYGPDDANGDIPMALPKDITPADVLLTALAHAELGQGAIRVYNDGHHVCTVSVP